VDQTTLEGFTSLFGEHLLASGYDPRSLPAMKSYLRHLLRGARDLGDTVAIESAYLSSRSQGPLAYAWRKFEAACAAAVPPIILPEMPLLEKRQAGAGPRTGADPSPPAPKPPVSILATRPRRIDSTALDGPISAAGASPVELLRAVKALWRALPTAHHETPCTLGVLTRLRWSMVRASTKHELMLAADEERLAAKRGESYPAGWLQPIGKSLNYYFMESSDDMRSIILMECHREVFRTFVSWSGCANRPDAAIISAAPDLPEPVTVSKLRAGIKRLEELGLDSDLPRLVSLEGAIPGGPRTGVVDADPDRAELLQTRDVLRGLGFPNLVPVPPDRR
jgi:hypothetical protein